MDGILLIDKPRGLTSHDVVARVRRLLKIRRVGHTGTLDPMATGVLPVAVGQGTRLVQFLMEGEKSYRATMKLGEITDTQDAEGQVVERHPVAAIAPEELDAARSHFIGDIWQVPPMFSAIKKNGVPLHRLARKGQIIEREKRRVHIEDIEILRKTFDEIEFQAICSKGTYIRTLAHDLGLALGPGAHLTQLCRTRTGIFTLEDCASLGQVGEEAHPGKTFGFLTLLEAVRDYPILQVNESAAGRLLDGIPPSAEQVQASREYQRSETVALVRGEHLLAMARFEPSRQREKRGDFELLKVFNQFSRHD